MVAASVRVGEGKVAVELAVAASEVAASVAAVAKEREVMAWVTEGAGTAGMVEVRAAPVAAASKEPSRRQTAGCGLQDSGHCPCT